MRLTDIHTHILYGVDDGAKDLNQAMRILEDSWKQGVGTVILTPHYGPKFGRPAAALLTERYEEIKKEAGKYYPEMGIFLGSEIYYQANTIQDLKNGKALSLNGTKYVLIEFGVNDSFGSILRAVQELVYAGFIPVIAHVERYKSVLGDLNKAQELANLGSLLQVNSKSLSGSVLNNVTKYCRKLLKEQLVHLIASDCHDLNSRTQDLARGVEIVHKKSEVDWANYILYKNPKNILEGKYI